jgi:hypothetical protein
MIPFLVSEGQVGENIGENNCTGDNVEGSALQSKFVISIF